MDANQRYDALTPEDLALDDEIRGLLAVEPSPAFLPAVRRRIAADAESRTWNLGWMFGAAATLAAAAAIVVAVRVARPAPSGDASPLPSSEIASAITAPPAAATPSVPVVERLASEEPVRASTPRIARSVTPEPEVLFDARERDAFRRWVVAAQTGGVDPAVLAATGRSATEPIAPVTELSVPPLAVDRLDGGGM